MAMEPHPKNPSPPSSARKNLTAEEQRRRFIEVAWEAGASGYEAAFDVDAALKQFAKAKPAS